MVSAAPLVSAGWLSFFSPLTPEPITNNAAARAVKDSRPLRSAIVQHAMFQVQFFAHLLRVFRITILIVRKLCKN